MIKTHTIVMTISVLFLVTLTVIPYAGTLSCPFVFDDTIIVEKISTGDLSSILLESGWRPLFNLSMLANYELSGRDVLSYHVFNISIHIFNTVLLFFLLCMILSLDSFARSCTYAEKIIISFGVACLWGLHPLCTESVTYISQRGESAMGTFLLLSVFFLMLGALCIQNKWKKAFFYLLSTCSCILGFGMKEAMISAPFIIVLFDRIFLCSSWQEFFKFRGKCYLALGFLVAIAAYCSGFASKFISSAFFSDYGLSSFSYLVNQSKVICHYIRLSILPYGQCFDYGWPVIISPYTSLFPYVAIVLLLMAMTAWALYRCKYVGFLGVFFFITLAPRSSFAPRPDLCVEHRMYLPLIICSCLVVFTLFRLLKLFSASFILCEKKEKFIKYSSSSIIILMALGLAISTHARNSVYKSEMSLWADTVAKSPNNPRALNYLGIEYCRVGNTGKGFECFVKALEIYPDYSLALNNLANIYASMHKFDAALELYQKSVVSSPKKNTKSFLQTMNNMARLLCNKKDYDSVIKISLFILERCPDNLNANYMLGKAFLNKHDPEKASEYFLKAMEPSASMDDVAGKIAGDISSCPDKASTSIVLKKLIAKHSSSAELNYEYGVLLLNDSRVNEAKECFEGASVVDFPRRPYSINNLGIIAKKEGDLKKAESLFRNAIALKPDYAGAHFNLGLLLMEKNDIDGAVSELQVAAKLAPDEDKIKKYLNQLTGRK